MFIMGFVNSNSFMAIYMSQSMAALTFVSSGIQVTAVISERNGNEAIVSVISMPFGDKA